MADLKTCVVCGAGSHRSDWIKKLRGFVGCDSHSDAEMATAVKKAETPVAVPAPKSMAASAPKAVAPPPTTPAPVEPPKISN